MRLASNPTLAAEYKVTEGGVPFEIGIQRPAHEYPDGPLVLAVVTLGMIGVEYRGIQIIVTRDSERLCVVNPPLARRFAEARNGEDGGYLHAFRFSDEAWTTISKAILDTYFRWLRDCGEDVA